MHFSNFDETLLMLVQKYGEAEFPLIRSHMEQNFGTSTNPDEINSLQLSILERRFCKLIGRPNHRMILPSSCNHDEDSSSDNSDTITFRGTRFTILDESDEVPWHFVGATEAEICRRQVLMNPDPYGRCKRQRDFVDSDNL